MCSDLTFVLCWFSLNLCATLWMYSRWMYSSHFKGANMWSPWIWKGVSATLRSGRYTLLYQKVTIYCFMVGNVNSVSRISYHRRVNPGLMLHHNLDVGPMVCPNCPIFVWYWLCMLWSSTTYQLAFTNLCFKILLTSDGVLILSRMIPLFWKFRLALSVRGTTFDVRVWRL